MKYTIAGLTWFALGYGVFFLLTPLWRRGLLPAWTRIPRGVVAWFTLLCLVGPSWEFGEVMVEMLSKPNMGVAFTLGGYFVLMSLAAWIYQNNEAFNYPQVKPLIMYSLFFRKPVDYDRDLFALEEQERIKAIHKEQTGKNLSFDKPSKKLTGITRDVAAQELNEIRRQRQTDTGKEDLERLAAGEGADITDVLRLFTMHGAPHKAVEKTFRLYVDPGEKVCHINTVFPGFRHAQVVTPDGMFRFKQEVIDLLQVLTGQEWLDRFRPYFDQIALTCFQEVRDSFDLPQQRPFLKLRIAMSHLDARKGKVFIATELDTLGTVEWLKDSEG